MKRLTVLITAGPTKEYLDPVRYISNSSSGKMGIALAKAAVKKSFKVIFVSGLDNLSLPKQVKTINVISALDMFKAVKTSFDKADIVICAAAVADFRPEKFAKNKIKKEAAPAIIKLKKNPDILEYCGKNKTKQIVAGFALETRDLKKNALLKLNKKNADLIIANGAATLNSDKISAILISKYKKPVEIKNVSKNSAAEKIINETLGIFKHIKTLKKNSKRV